MNDIVWAGIKAAPGSKKISVRSVEDHLKKAMHLYIYILHHSSFIWVSKTEEVGGRGGRAGHPVKIQNLPSLQIPILYDGLWIVNKVINLGGVL